MVKQYTENQYDDDLTVGTDDYDDSYYNSSVDLFEFSNDEDSPISRLKSLILSIDWEITDEVLLQFNEELVDLRDIWAGKKINLVYVQALEKISKYIYQKKADSHPSAIKLLLTLYHNLEKIVSSYDLTEEQKKEILLEDVKRFEKLKRYISQQPETTKKSTSSESKQQKHAEVLDNKADLLNLKAIVLGIDWEITDDDLNRLRQEVVRLEKKYTGSRPKLILLQGIGTLGAYIKLKKSKAHADAFKILHLFYESLEKIAATPMDFEEEKAILFPAVEKFNSFKSLLGSASSPEVDSRSAKEADESEESAGYSDSVITPAFADLPEEEIMGFQAEEEAKSLGLDNSGNVENRLDNFFMESDLENREVPHHSDPAGMLDEGNPSGAIPGVDVELDDEEDDQDRMPAGGKKLAPALSAVVDEDGPAPSFLDEDAQDEGPIDSEGIEDYAADMFANSFLDSGLGDEGDAQLDFSSLDKDTVLQGVDVETEADDDSDEEALPMLGGELAPALVENEEVSDFQSAIFEDSSETKSVDEEISGETAASFFDEENDSQPPAATEVEADGSDKDWEQTDTESEAAEIDDIDVDPIAMEGGFFSEDEDLEPPADEYIEPALAELAPDDTDEPIAFVSDQEQEETLNSFFDDSDCEQNPEESRVEDDLVDDSALGLSAEVRNETPVNVDEQLDTFFDLAKENEIDDDVALSSTLSEQELKDSVSVEDDVDRQVLDDTEEEVVFQLVEEEEPILDEEEEVEDTTEEFPEELLSADEAIDSSPVVDEDIDVESISEQLVSNPETEIAPDAYVQLRTCVESLGIELDDKIITGLWEEVDHLQQSLLDKPVEKTFLQLFSTVARHIDQNRYDSSANAYGLLQSICSSLIELRQNDLHHNQELLFSETAKVLKWQEDVLAEQVAKSEAELTIGDSILSDQEDITPIDGEDDSLFDQYETEKSGGHDESPGLYFNTEASKMNADDIRQEISILRQSLQNEIAALRKELKSNYS